LYAINDIPFDIIDTFKAHQGCCVCFTQYINGLGAEVCFDPKMLHEYDHLSTTNFAAACVITTEKHVYAPEYLRNHVQWMKYGRFYFTSIQSCLYAVNIDTPHLYYVKNTDAINACWYSVESTFNPQKFIVEWYYDFIAEISAPQNFWAVMDFCPVTLNMPIPSLNLIPVIDDVRFEFRPMTPYVEKVDLKTRLTRNTNIGASEVRPLFEPGSNFNNLPPPLDSSHMLNKYLHLVPAGREEEVKLKITEELNEDEWNTVIEKLEKPEPVQQTKVQLFGMFSLGIAVLSGLALFHFARRVRAPNRVWFNLFTPTLAVNNVRNILITLALGFATGFGLVGLSASIAVSVFSFAKTYCVTKPVAAVKRALSKEEGRKQHHHGGNRHNTKAKLLSNSRKATSHAKKKDTHVEYASDQVTTIMFESGGVNYMAHIYKNQQNGETVVKDAWIVDKSRDIRPIDVKTARDALAGARESSIDTLRGTAIGYENEIPVVMPAKFMFSGFGKDQINKATKNAHVFGSAKKLDDKGNYLVRVWGPPGFRENTIDYVGHAVDYNNHEAIFIDSTYADFKKQNPSVQESRSDFTVKGRIHVPLNRTDPNSKNKVWREKKIANSGTFAKTPAPLKIQESKLDIAACATIPPQIVKQLLGESLNSQGSPRGSLSNNQ
jgi:hypothetical protein